MRPSKQQRSRLHQGLTKKGEYWADLEAVDCYPDTIGPDGKWNSTFVLVLKEKTDG